MSVYICRQCDCGPHRELALTEGKNKMGSLYSSVELVPTTSSVHLTIALNDSIHSNDLLNQLETIDLPYSLCS